MLGLRGWAARQSEGWNELEALALVRMCAPMNGAVEKAPLPLLPAVVQAAAARFS